MNNTESMRYAGFWLRSGALLIDFFVMLPLILFWMWGSNHTRHFEVYFIVPEALFGLFYNVYLVRRFGGTPGKLLFGIRIRKSNGEPVGYREAFLRYFLPFIFDRFVAIAFLLAILHMSDAEFQSHRSKSRAEILAEFGPVWYGPCRWVQEIWNGADIIVFLANRKWRALHDLIAGTVVVYAEPKNPQELKTADPVISA